MDDLAGVLALPCVGDADRPAVGEQERAAVAGLPAAHRVEDGAVETDALVVVVSEETGRVSIARDGIMTRGVKIDRFKGIMRSIFTPSKGRLAPSFIH